MSHAAPGTVFTIGHSTRSADDFVALLRENGVQLLVDVRRFPGSRRHPQFGQEPLRAALAEAGIAAEVAGRPKHIFSIWKKMQRKGLDFSELYDIRAVRVLVGSLADCYAALGIVHARRGTPWVAICLATALALALASWGGGPAGWQVGTASPLFPRVELEAAG